MAYRRRSFKKRSFKGRRRGRGGKRLRTYKMQRGGIRM